MIGFWKLVFSSLSTYLPWQDIVTAFSRLCVRCGISCLNPKHSVQKVMQMLVFIVSVLILLLRLWKFNTGREPGTHKGGSEQEMGFGSKSANKWACLFQIKVIIFLLKVRETQPNKVWRMSAVPATQNENLICQQQLGKSDNKFWPKCLLALKCGNFQSKTK